jgi:hypothetical protein
LPRERLPLLDHCAAAAAEEEAPVDSGDAGCMLTPEQWETIECNMPI